MRLGRAAARLLGEGAQQTLLDRIRHVGAAVHRHRTYLDALDELLVTISGVKLHQTDALLAPAGQQACEMACDVGFAGARHTLQDQLSFQVKEAARSVEPIAAK